MSVLHGVLGGRTELPVLRRREPARRGRYSSGVER